MFVFQRLNVVDNWFVALFIQLWCPAGVFRVLLAVGVGINVTRGRGRKMKVQAKLVRWSTSSWQVEASGSVLSGCGATTLYTSASEGTVAVGGSDGSIGVYTAETLSRVFTAAPHHGMAVTNVVLIPPRSASKSLEAHPPLLLSVGLDNEVHTTIVAAMSFGELLKENAPLLFALLMMMLAIIVGVLMK